MILTDNFLSWANVTQTRFLCDCEPATTLAQTAMARALIRKRFNLWIVVKPLQIAQITALGNWAFREKMPDKYLSVLLIDRTDFREFKYMECPITVAVYSYFEASLVFN